jgi:hypothetical protein
MNEPPEGTPITIDIGDGRTIRMDMPGTGVMAALLRARSAIEAGRAPDPGDVARVAAWLDGQEEKRPPSPGECF